MKNFNELQEKMSQERMEASEARAEKMLWPKYIEFEETEDTGKTKIWAVKTKEGQMLGDIRWHGTWRCYVYNPWPMTLYEHQCLEDIARFCNEQTAELRSTWKASRSRLVKGVK